MNQGAVNHRNFGNLQGEINDSRSNFCGCQAPNLFQQSLSDNKWLSIISLPPIRKKLSFIYCNDLHSYKKNPNNTQPGVPSIPQTIFLIMALNLRSQYVPN